MHTLRIAIALLLVAGISYSLGLWQGGAARKAQTIPLPSGKNEPQPASSASAPNPRVAASRNESLPDPTAPFARNVTSSQRGYAAAEANLDEAFRQIDSLPASERMGFITGIMSFIARNHSPADALKLYQFAPEAHRPNALRALVSEWVYSRSPLDEQMRLNKRDGTLTISGSRLGLEVELSSMLASAKPDPELVNAWLDSFSSHSSRSEILRSLFGSLPRDPDSILSRAENWTTWEKERVTRGYLFGWASESPREAWAWFQDRTGQLPPEYASSILTPWAYADPQAAKEFLNTLQDPAQRRAAIGAVGNVLAGKNTDEAIAWADSFPNPQERQAAQQAVYDGAPRGIGAVLDFEKGFPKLRAIVPGSPLEGTAAKPGDQLVEVRAPDGTRHELYGRDMATVVNLLRGEPGTELTLRVLRQNELSGELEEQFLPLRRGQLYLNEKGLKN